MAAEDVAQRLGIDVQVLFAGNDAIAQSGQLLNAIQSSADARPDGVVCAPVGTSLVRVASSAAEAGVGWALLNREGEYVDELRRKHPTPIFSVSVDQAEVGRIQGEQIRALLPEGGLVLYVLGPKANPIAKERLTWMQKVMPANVQLRTLSGDWSEQSGYNAVSRWLQLKTSHETPVTLVAAQNDDMAMGARRAFEDETHGQARERWTSLPYIGCDSCPGAGQEWVRSGRLTASVIHPATAGLAIEMMVRAIQTKSQTLERMIVDPVSDPPIAQLARIPAHAS